MHATDDIALSDGDFRDLFARSPIGRVVLAARGADFVCVEANESAAAYFETARDQMLGRGLSALFSADVAEQVLASCETCVRTKKPTTCNAVPRISGGIRLHALVLNPLMGPDGAVRLIDVATRADMPDSVQLQRERDDALMLLTSLFDASGLGIIVTDRHGRVVRVNDSFLADYGWAREDLLGEEFTVIVPPEGHAVARKLHQTFIERGQHDSREMQILRHDGNLADVVATTALLELSQKRRFMVTTVRDMTERKNMMRRLKWAKEEADSASRAKSAFLASMSHELRTPLNAIIGFAELMRNQTFGPVGSKKYEEYLGDIHFSARHLLEIINDVLDMSKIEAGKVELVESEVAVPEVLESVQRIMADRAQAAGIDLDFRVAPDLPHLKVDQRLLRQILINLVSNAVKFSPAGKKVWLTADLAPDGGFRLVVEDHGCGIPADKLGHVMEPFGQVKDPRHYAGQGTGLGLPLARAMTELHGGRLTLRSTEGQGTTVQLDLPPTRTLPRL